MANGEKTQELIETLEQGIKDTLNSERYKAFLKMQSQFHRYSASNAMLIFLQKPDATYVAGYNTWKDKFERNVLKGETGIGILAPSPYKHTIYSDAIDDKGNPIIDGETGQVKKVKDTIERLGFKKVSVFDIKQTEGKELPSICKDLQGNSANADLLVKAIQHVSDVPIHFMDIKNGSKGYYSRAENIIAIKNAMSLDQTAKTTVHEYAHSKIHNSPACALLDKSTKEVQAESVAFVVSNYFGVDTSSYSFDYVANWSSNKELPELKKSFEIIQKTADKIIESVEAAMEKMIELQHAPAKIEIIWSESDKFKSGQFIDIKEANELFAKYEGEQFEIRKANPVLKPEDMTAGSNHPYIPFLKIKFMVHLQDGRTSEARFDVGAGDYKNLYECIKKECYIDIEDYLKKHALKPMQTSVIDTIINQYSQECPAIKYISESTAATINSINEKYGSIQSIKDIKNLYKSAGKAFELSNKGDDLQTFNALRDVVDELKHANKTMKNETAKNKTNKIEITNSKAFELELT
jgi:hypothetical protein